MVVYRVLRVRGNRTTSPPPDGRLVLVLHSGRSRFSHFFSVECGRLAETNQQRALPRITIDLHVSSKPFETMIMTQLAFGLKGRKKERKNPTRQGVGNGTSERVIGNGRGRRLIYRDAPSFITLASLSLSFSTVSLSCFQRICITIIIDHWSKKKRHTAIVMCWATVFVNTMSHQGAVEGVYLKMGEKQQLQERGDYCSRRVHDEKTDSL